MSMTQIAFLRKAEIPTKSKIEDSIIKFGYDFKILGEFDNLYGQEGLNCKINGYETYFEIYFEEPSEVINDFEWIEKDLTDQDITISFVWGADFAAGACIGLMFVALIDICDALIYYIDDEMKYSRQMLLNDTPEFLNELERQGKSHKNEKPRVEIKQNENSKSFLDKLKGFFRS